jgi:hypothetical protein
MAGRPSAAAEKAAAYLKANPGTTAMELAKKFGLSLSAVVASKYWKGRQK